MGSNTSKANDRTRCNLVDEFLPNGCEYRLDTCANNIIVYIDKLEGTFSFEDPAYSILMIKTKYPSTLYIGEPSDDSADYINHSGTGEYSEKNVTIITNNYNSEQLPANVNLIINGSDANDSYFYTDLTLTTLITKKRTVDGNANIKCERAILSYGCYPTDITFSALKMLRLCYMTLDGYDKSNISNDSPIDELMLYNCEFTNDDLDNIVKAGVKKIIVIDGTKNNYEYMNDPYFEDDDIDLTKREHNGVMMLTNYWNY